MADNLRDVTRRGVIGQGESESCSPDNFLQKWCNLVRFGVYFDIFIAYIFSKLLHFYKLELVKKITFTAKGVPNIFSYRKFREIVSIFLYVWRKCLPKS